jgi:hypothetical protein
MAEEHEHQPGLPQQANLTARPPFPIHVLPPKIRAMAEAVAAFMTTGKDLSAAVAMTVLNAAICGGVRIMHRGHPERVTPSGTFNVSIGVSGSGKSVIGGLMMKPIFDFEREAQERFGRDVRPGLEAERIEVEAEIKLLSNEAAKPREEKGADAKARRNRLTDLLRRKHEIEERMHPPQFIIEDSTVQSFARLLKATGGRVLILSTDAREIIANLLGRYNNGKADDSILLKGYSGEGFKFTRKGPNGIVETINVASTAMSMHIMVQPDKATEMAERKELQEGGLLQRINFVWSDNRPGRASLSKPIPPEIREDYQQFIFGLMRTYYCAEGEVMFYLSDESWQALEDYKEAAQVAAGDGSHPSWTFHTRDSEIACRLAAGLHAGDLGDKAHEIDIPVETIRRAITLMDYYNIDRMMIADNMEDRSDDKVMAKLRDLATTYPDGFSPREAQRKRIAGMHKGAEAVQAILDQKVKNGVLQLVDEGPPRYKFALR